MDILRILYDAKPDPVADDAAYCAALEATCKAEQALLEAYSDAAALLNAYQSAQLNLFSHKVFFEFTQGFKMGMLLAEEVHQ